MAKAKRAKGYKWKPQTPLMCFIDVLAVLLLPLMLNQGSAEQGADISMAKAPVKMSAVQRPAGAKEPPPVDVFVSLAGERFVLLLDGVEVSAEEVQEAIEARSATIANVRFDAQLDALRVIEAQQRLRAAGVTRLRPLMAEKRRDPE